jgi:hypothetical protein
MKRLVPAIVLLFLAGRAAPAAAPAGLRLHATPALSPCAAALGQAFTSERGVSVSLETAEAAEAATGADVLIADASELTRVLEGGPGDARSAVALGSVPWVMVTPTREAAPGGLAALAANAGSPIAVLGGIAGREARAALAQPGASLAVSGDAAALRVASHALVPRSLAGPGRRTVVAEVAPLSATAVPLVGSPRPGAVRAFLGFLTSPAGRSAFGSCGGEAAASGGATSASASARYAQAVTDWWVPSCSLARNAYNDPGEVLGAPDAENTGGKDEYRGMMSLGQGGWVVVDMGRAITDGPGADVRVYQTTSGEPVSLYAAESPSGPFQLVGLMRGCGIPSHFFSNYCDFDLANGGVKSARYFRVEDGEIYPCLAGDTLTEGADIDAVESLRR